MAERIRVEVTDKYGTVAEIIDVDALLQRWSARKRAKLAELADGLIRDVAGVLRSDEEHARWVICAVLMRLVADEAAYERVAGRRGVLPL